MDNSPSSQTQIADLQKSFGTNWTKENIKTIFEWLTIASFNIVCLDMATKYYKKTIRNSIILGMVFSTISGTLSVSEIVVKIGFPDDVLPVLGYVLNSLFIICSSLVISQTSNTSNNSVRNITSFGPLAKGQYLNKPSTKWIARGGSFERNCVFKYINLQNKTK
jgi:hypothetical protein